MIQLKEEHLKREIGVWGQSANIINIIIGAGIFVLPAIVAEGLGAAGVLAYLVCGLLVGLIMFCFAEVGSKITLSGGAYTYIEAAFGKYAGFVATWLFLYACVTADAAVVNALADVLGTMIPVFKAQWFRVLFFFALFAGLAWLNVVGVKQGIGLVKFNTIAKLAPLLLLVLVGWTQITGSNLQWEGMPSVSSLGEISLILFFAFQGAESALTVGGEVRDPHRTIPKSILFGVGGILILYILIQVTAQGVLGDALANAKDAPLAEAAKVILGPFGFTCMIVGAAISMFGYLSGEILSIPRVVYRASLDNVIPIKVLSKVHPKFTTPFVAIIAWAALDFLLASVGGFKQLAIASSAAILLLYLGVAFSAMKLRKTNVDSIGFKTPGGFIIPVAASIGIFWVLTNLTRNELIGIIVFLGVVSLIYFAMVEIRKQKK